MNTANYNNQIFKQLEKVMAKCDNLSSEIKDIKIKHSIEISNLKQEHKKEINKLNQKIETLEKENAYLKIENKILRDENDRLKGIINKDSSNSSIPPSKDSNKPKKKTNLREKSNKKKGAQKGHKGNTFTKEDVEKLLENKDVKKQKIIHGNPKDKYCITKYEIDTKTIVIVKEHKFYFSKYRDIKLPREFIPNVHYGENFKTLCDIMVVEEVISLERIKQFIEILTNGLLKISEGSIVNWIKEKSKQLKPTIKNMKIALKNTSLLQTDATETSLNGNKAYVRNYSTNNLTLLIPSKSKKISRIKRQWILDNYTGFIVHDHDTSLYNFGFNDKHVECNVHLRRYLKNNIELNNHEWAKQMDTLLLEIKDKKEKYISENIFSFSNNELENYSKKYDEILELGFKENDSNNSKYLKQEEKALLKRLKKYKENHLLFAYNFDVPFDNNLSERDLRPIKTKKKISGCHRSFNILKDYCNIRSIISSCKKQGINYFHELVNVGKNKPITVI